jgi:drug/metabolite transporter (DMT)-like permease
MSEPVIIGIVLLAAVMHAAWNALVKQSSDRLLTFATVIGTGGALFTPVALLAGPPAPASIPYIAGSMAIHLSYFAGLLLGYRYGDLGHVYPVARGTGPLVVALVSAPLAHEHLSSLAIAGVVTVSVGIFSLSRRGGAHAARATVFAVLTGLTIAGYTMCDGLGVRLSGNPLVYIAWVNVMDGVPFALVVLGWQRARVGDFFRRNGKRALAGGLLGASAYSLVIWAMSTTQLAFVASLREISVVLAALIGTVFLGEPFGRRRVIASGVIAVGIVAIGIGR